MTAVEQVGWEVGDDCFYRASPFATPPTPCVVSAINGDLLTITTASRYVQTFYVFADEITRREL